MTLLTLLIPLTAFIFAASLVAWLYLAWADSRFAQRLVVRRRLLHLSAGGSEGQDKFSLYKERTLRDQSSLTRFFFQLPRLASLDRLLVRSNTSLTAGTFILLSLSLGGGATLLGMKFLPQPVVGVALGAGLALVPYLLLKLGERKTRQAFYEQLPEALDLMARAVRTGYALTAALELVASEMPAPLQGEFAEAVDEIKFGISLEDALNNMCQRMPLTDLRYFTVTVVIHKETGGNIAQVFDNLAGLIRGRLQFKRQILALTGEGRISAFVLLMLPIAMFVYLYLVNQSYVSILWTDPAGRLLSLGAVLGQIMGYLVMKRMIDVQV